MDERPTLVENSSPELFRNIDGTQVGRAEGCDKEHELQIRHPGVLDIKGLHTAAIIDREGDGVNPGYRVSNEFPPFTGRIDGMVTIVLTGQLQTVDGERDLACEIAAPISVRQLIQKQGVQLRHLLQLLREKKVLVTINKRIASDDSLVQDGDAVRLVGHDGMGGSGLGPSHF